MSLLIAIALQAVPIPSTTSEDVVVVGHRLRDALAECIASDCPAEREVEAAMNASSESFYAGRYEEAKATLQRTIARNKSYAARMPGKMSDLYATYADVAEHEGDEAAFRAATVSSVDVLRKYAGRDALVTIVAAPRIGDMFANIGQTATADNAYRSARDEAARHGQPAIAARINVRRAWLAFSANQLSEARQMIAETERNYPADPGASALLRALKVRIALRGGDNKTADVLLADMRTFPSARPVLVYEPPYPQLDATMSSPFDATGDLFTGGSTTGELVVGRSTSGLSDWGDYRWADIGFWVRPDGTTSEPQILRSSVRDDWAKPVLAQVAKRRYAPLTVEAGSPGSYRIERMSIRPRWQQPTGSHIQRRMGEMTLHFVDLTGVAENEATSNGSGEKHNTAS